MKKVLSLVLVVALVLSSMTFAFAAKFSDVTGDYTTAIEALAGFGVIGGYPDGTFKPANTITRAEIVKLLVEALGYKDLVAGAKSNFTDTQGHWADAYIALAAGRGITTGYPNGTFAPNATVTYDEAITFIVRSLGYTDGSNVMKGMSWPTNYKVKAAELGITDGVKLSTAGADRGGVAKLLFNALEENIVTINADGDVTAETTPKQLISRLGSLKEDTVNEDGYVKIEPKHMDKKDDAYLGNIVDLTPYMYQDVDYYANKDGDLVYVKKVHSLVLEGKVNQKVTDYIQVKDAAGNNTDFVKTALAAKAPNIYFNGVEVDYNVDKINTTSDSIKLVAADADKDSKVDANEITGIILNAQTSVQKIENTYVAGKDKIDGIVLPKTDDKVDLTKVTVVGAATSLADIKEDDIVTVYAGTNTNGTLEKVKLAVSRNVVEGEVTRVDGADRYINGVKYSLNKVAYTSYDNTTLALGTSGKFFLDNNGKIATTEATTTANYAIVIGAQNGELQEGFGAYSIKTMPKIKVVTKAGETVVYDLYVKLASDGKSFTEVAKIDTSNSITGGFALGDKVITASAFNALSDDLVKITLNANNQVTEVKTVTKSANLTYDKDNVAFKLASNVLVFDATKAADDKYSVVDKSRLEDDKTALFIVYNSDGYVDAIVTANLQGGDASTYAYVDKISTIRNAAGEDVNYIVAYMNNQKVEYVEDGKDAVAKMLHKFEIANNVVTEATTFGALSDPAINTITATVTSVNATSKSIVIDSANNAQDGRYFLGENATILKLNNGADGLSTAGTVNSVKDIYDLDEQVVTIYQDNTTKAIIFVTYGYNPQ